MKNIMALFCISLAIIAAIIMMLPKTKDEIVHTIEPVVEVSETIEEHVIEEITKDQVETIVETEKALFSISDIPTEIATAMMGVSYTINETISLDDLKYLQITYYDFDHQVQIGEMIVHKIVADEVLEIFREMYLESYTFASIQLVYHFDGDDNISMLNNNTHAFNFRYITGGSTLSNHAFGLAIDVNPMQNPYINRDLILPSGSEEYADRNSYKLGMIIKEDPLYRAFISQGWSWGGEWDSLKDYQHFEKNIEGLND